MNTQTGQLGRREVVMFPGPSVVVGARIAAMLARPLGDMLRRYRTVDGGVPDAELTAIVEAIEVLAREFRSSSDRPHTEVGTPGMPPDGSAVMLQGVSVQAAATHFGISTRAVRARCQRGSLPAVKAAGVWFVDIEEIPRTPYRTRTT